MLPKLSTLSLLPADAANATPWGRTYPLWRRAADADDDRDVTEGCEKVDPETVECAEDEVAENERLSGGQANSAGVGENEGDGEESRVKGGEPEASLSVAEAGLRVFVGK